MSELVLTGNNQNWLIKMTWPKMILHLVHLLEMRIWKNTTMMKGNAKRTMVNAVMMMTKTKKTDRHSATMMDL